MSETQLSLHFAEVQGKAWVIVYKSKSHPTTDGPICDGDAPMLFKTKKAANVWINENRSRYSLGSITAARAKLLVSSIPFRKSTP